MLHAEERPNSTKDDKPSSNRTAVMCEKKSVEFYKLRNKSECYNNGVHKNNREKLHQQTKTMIPYIIIEKIHIFGMGRSMHTVQQHNFTVQIGGRMLLHSC
eukprot:c34150_g1_i1.p2 GENE.c34150_g1_i1~~c34150_g1_i1.p2  ORF type:complete len:101 (-),score=2.78 c34150_g1_i1:251-553(-)